jgi:hypothetical protein
MAGAELRLLQRPGEIGRIQRGAHRVAAMAVDQTQRLRRQAARRVDDMRDERLAGDRMQNLGQVGMHALPLPGGENDDIHGAFPVKRTVDSATQRSSCPERMSPSICLPFGETNQCRTFLSLMRVSMTPSDFSTVRRELTSSRARPVLSVRPARLP